MSVILALLLPNGRWRQKSLEVHGASWLKVSGTGAKRRDPASKTRLRISAQGSPLTCGTHDPIHKREVKKKTS